MINFQPNKPHTPHHIPLNEGARKVFEEASGVSDLFVPEVEERYEDMAADFLEQWLKADSKPQSSEPAPSVKAAVQPSDSPQPAAAPALTSFSLDLDWQLSDGRKLS